ncbi:NADH:ubiquinone oxidoreductase subunit J [Desulfolithobacter dissulfuricans]|uniref:NADH-quinone oxidoreductase subunit J n=1 Tax=Desulfolithobacter dissulfuricans TaxID=2795293 RepID=A0A915TYD3_9BACT|nr:NADH-quinone oxidoreductase subunit J [Desulfolithobacter dissulfuricans]BCO08054.1 NADH:ubiquinone oxidoreductase subunit J [Desulfolithobacter dissulfuricans]
MQPVICQPAANPSLFTAEGMVGLIFLFLIATVITGALIATMARRLIRAVAGLAVCFTGVAGIYYFLLSPFVAMMQMLIYVGAVSILIAFAIMLAEPEYKDPIGRKNPPLAGPLGFSVGALFFAAFTLLGLNTDWQVFPREGTGDMHHMGITLLTTHSMVFELISIVLLIAIIGALVVARRGRD